MWCAVIKYTIDLGFKALVKRDREAIGEITKLQGLGRGNSAVAGM